MHVHLNCYKQSKRRHINDFVYTRTRVRYYFTQRAVNFYGWFSAGSTQDHFDGDGAQCGSNLQQDSRADGQAAIAVCHQAGRHGGRQQRRQTRIVRVSRAVQIPPLELHGHRHQERVRPCRRRRYVLFASLSTHMYILYTIHYTINIYC